MHQRVENERKQAARRRGDIDSDDDSSSVEHVSLDSDEKIALIRSQLPHDFDRDNDFNNPIYNELAQDVVPET